MEETKTTVESECIDPDFDVVKVQIEVTIKLPKGKSWTETQKANLAHYLSQHHQRCIGEFQPFDWGMGAFMCQAFPKPEDDPDIIRARVYALDNSMVYSSDDYTKEQFINIFGQTTYNNLKRGWPRKAAAALGERVVNFSRFDQVEPKLVELD
jgi:phenylpyruvate tautomerase PptA (4-oxalocrotonate tautomerase family)